MGLEKAELILGSTSVSGSQLDQLSLWRIWVGSCFYCHCYPLLGLLGLSAFVHLSSAGSPPFPKKRPRYFLSLPGEGCLSCLTLCQLPVFLVLFLTWNRELQIPRAPDPGGHRTRTSCEARRNARITRVQLLGVIPTMSDWYSMVGITRSSCIIPDEPQERVRLNKPKGNMWHVATLRPLCHAISGTFAPLSASAWYVANSPVVLGRPSTNMLDDQVLTELLSITGNDKVISEAGLLALVLFLLIILGVT